MPWTQISTSIQPDDVTAADLNLVHLLTGPVHIEGAARGDVLAVTLIDIEPDEYGYTVIVPGFGFLRDRFTEPFIANWKLDRVEAVSDQIPGLLSRSTASWVPWACCRASRLGKILAREAALQVQAASSYAAALQARCRGHLRRQRQPQERVSTHDPAPRKRRQHGRQADAGGHDAASAVFRGRLRPVHRRRALRAGRRRGLRHGDRNGGQGPGRHASAQGPGRMSRCRISKATTSSRDWPRASSTPQRAFR